MKERPLTSLLLTIEEAAEQLRMSPGYVRKEIREGRLRKVKLGTRARVEYSEIERYVESLRPVVDSNGSPCVPAQLPDHEWSRLRADSITGDF